MIEPKEFIYSYEKEFLQAVEQYLKSIALVLESDAHYRHTAMFERLVEPERMVTFRVPWTDDRSRIRVNRGFRYV